jgi:hypothetical protein
MKQYTDQMRNNQSDKSNHSGKRNTHAHTKSTEENNGILYSFDINTHMKRLCLSKGKDIQ